MSRWDAVVVGGGPAGSTAAHVLAKSGRKVLLLEKQRFPRHHIGESLLPGLNYLYRRLGLSERLKAEGFFTKTGGSYVWGRSRRPWSITFIRFDDAPLSCATSSEATAYHVDRARFDQVLLEECAKAGAEVAQPATVTDVRMEGEAVASVRWRGEGGREREEKARYYIDASGQAAVLARGLGWRRFDPDLRNMAVYSYFEGMPPLEGERANHIFIVNIGDGWIWVIPLAGGRTSVGAVCSVDKAKEAGRDPEGFLLSRLRRAPEVARLMGGARRVEPVRLERDWSYRSRSFRGPNFLLAGDAAAFVDPLLSYGVTLAMHSGALAGDCVDLALANPRRAEEALAHYGKVHSERFDELLDFVKYFYDANRHRSDYFWKARRVVSHVKNRYSCYAFTYLVSGFTMWDRVLHKSYFSRFFSGIGAPTARLKRDPRFLRKVAGLGPEGLPRLIDDAFPPPPGAEDWVRRSLALRYALEEA